MRGPTTRCLAASAALLLGAGLAGAVLTSARSRRGLAPRPRRVGGLRVFARATPAVQDPEAVPVVLLHGFGVSGSYWLPTAERLARRFEVHVPALPGHGRSDTPPAPLGIPELADALVAWMDAAGLPRAVIVAHSMGCQVAVHAARRYPGRFLGMVLIGPTGDPTVHSAFGLIARFLACVPFERVSLGPIVLVDYLRMGPRSLGELWSMLREPTAARLGPLGMPVLVVRGERDAIAPRRWCVFAARRLGACLVEIARWGHAVNYSAPRELATILTPFLAAAGSRHAGGMLPGTPSGTPSRTGSAAPSGPCREPAGEAISSSRPGVSGTEPRDDVTAIRAAR